MQLSTQVALGTSRLGTRTSLPPLHPTSLPHSPYVEPSSPSSPSPMTSEVEGVHLTHGAFCRYRSVVDMVKSWHQEKQHYSFPHPRECNPRCPSKCSGSVCSHYTQVSTAVPCNPPEPPAAPTASCSPPGPGCKPGGSSECLGLLQHPVQGAALLPAADGIGDQILPASNQAAGLAAGSVPAGGVQAAAGDALPPRAPAGIGLFAWRSQGLTAC